jgi:hypothetical protein
MSPGSRAAAAGRKAPSGRRRLLSSPDSSTVLVSSSTNSGTPSVLAMICVATSSGSGLSRITRSTRAAPSRWRGRESASALTRGCVGHGGLNSGR